MQPELPFNTPPETPLDHLTDAIWNEDAKDVQERLKGLKTSDLNKRDRYGSTALIGAVRMSDVDLVKQLIEKGADVNLKDSANDTALNLAALKGYNTIAELLLDKGAGSDEPGRNGYTPLMTAIETGFSDIAALLLKKGADPGKEVRGMTPLASAIEIGDAETQRLLEKAIEDRRRLTAQKAAEVVEKARQDHIAAKQFMLLQRARRAPKLRASP